MRVFRAFDEIDERRFERGTALAIGKFDGVHLGHQALLARLTEAARDAGLESVVLTFTNHPLTLLNPEQCPDLIASPAQRLEVIAAAGVDSCIMVPFDPAFAGQDPEAFIRELMVERLRVRHVIIGEDFRFGRGGAGTPRLLEEAGREFGFAVEVFAPIGAAGHDRISSSRIRELILDGDVAEASRLLGRQAAVRGEVVRGDARGRELGFPTANLGTPIEGLVPSDGVYAGWVDVDGAAHAAAISVGTNPTFTSAAERRVEAYLLDFEGDLYGKRIQVRFVDRVRGMETFADVEALIRQMGVDVARTRQTLGIPSGER